MRVMWLVQKEVREVRRDPMSLRSIFLVPILQLIVLGYAANLDVTRAPIAVRDGDRSQQSRQLIAELAAQGHFAVAAETSRSSDLVHYLDRGTAQLALDIPPGFGEAAAGGRSEVQVLIDGSDAASSGLAAGYMSGFLADHAARVTEQRFERRDAGAPPVPRIEPETRVWFNPDLKSVNFFVPAVAAQILLIISQMFTAMAIVRERELGTLEQLSVTPIRPVELMLGKMLPFAVTGMIDFTIVLLVAKLWFHVPLRGSVPFLYLAALPFLICTLGTGLVISVFCKTQQQALITNFFFTMPAMLLSGFVFPIANMPKVLQWLTYAVPLRYFLEIIRGVFLQGVGPHVLWRQCVAMVGIGVVLVFFGVRGFRKRLG